MHDGDGTDLFFREFVGALKVVDLDLARIIDRTEILSIRISGAYRGEQLINFVL
jgi:hypothetical protein